MKKYVDELVTSLKSKRQTDRHLDHYPFITISREAGAGGHELATAIQERMSIKGYSDLFKGWELFDYDLCKAIADDPSFHVSLQALLAERYHSDVHEFLAGFKSSPDEDLHMYREIFSITKALAELGKVILVGRGGVNVTRNQPGGIHIRLVAARESRIQRMATFLEIPEEDAEQVMDHQDKDKARLVKSFFARNISDPSLYDEVWDTTQTPMTELADKAIELVQEKAKSLHRE